MEQQSLMGMLGVTQDYIVVILKPLKVDQVLGRKKIPLFRRAAPKTESHGSQLYKVYMYSCYFVAYNFQFESVRKCGLSAVP